MADSEGSGDVSLAGLFPVLRQIRSRAGLTQEQIARATGAGGKHGHKLIARLEAGHISNPSVRLVLDYLRACRATSRDLAVFLDNFSERHLSYRRGAGAAVGRRRPSPSEVHLQRSKTQYCSPCAERRLGGNCVEPSRWYCIRS